MTPPDFPRSMNLQADALLAAERPGAAALVCVIAGLIIAENVPDVELSRLCRTLGKAWLGKNGRTS